MTDAERSAWLERRRLGVGGSDAPSLAGCGFADARRVWLEKVGDAPSKVGGQLQRGLDLEDVVARKYEETMGVGLTPGEMVWLNDWQFATTDRRRPDGRPVELKTVAGFGPDWGPAGTDVIPDGYKLQVIHQGGVTNSDFVDLVALDVIMWEPRVYRIEIDRKAWEWLTEVERQFWAMVQRKEMPPAGWEKQWAGAAPLVVAAGKSVELPAAAAELLDRRERLKAVERQAKERLDDVEGEIAAMMGDAQVGAAPGWTVRRTVVPAGVVEQHERAAYVRTNYRRSKA